MQILPFIRVWTEPSQALNLYFTRSGEILRGESLVKKFKMDTTSEAEIWYNLAALM